jgi:hypothetical protein
LQEFHSCIDTFLKRTDTITIHDIEDLASKEDNLSKKVELLEEKTRGLGEDFETSINETLQLIKGSLTAVKLKMYGDFGDQASISSTTIKVQQMQQIIENQIKQSADSILMSVPDDLEEQNKNLVTNLKTSEGDILFAQSKLKSRTTSLCKEALAFEVRTPFHLYKTNMPFYIYHIT